MENTLDLLEKVEYKSKNLLYSVQVYNLLYKKHNNNKKINNNNTRSSAGLVSSYLNKKRVTITIFKLLSLKSNYLISYLVI